MEASLALQRASAETPSSPKQPVETTDEKLANEKAPSTGDESDVEHDTADKQYGVEKIRAITSAWSYKALVGTYIL
jgi:hypothetical protein